MKNTVILLLFFSFNLQAQINEFVVDLGPSEAIQGIVELENGNFFLGGYSGEEPNQWRAVTLEWNEREGAFPETVMGDPGATQWQAVTQIASVPLAGGGIVNANRGEFTQFQAVTFRPNGDPWVIYETTAFMGANNMVLDVQPVGETHFAAAGFVTFDFGGEEFIAPTAMISRVSGNGPQNYPLESWNGPLHGLGVFLKVEVEDEKVLHFLFEEWDDDQLIVGYKIMSYELESGELLYFFEVSDFQKVFDFKLAPDGRSWYIAGHRSDLAGPIATVAQVGWDGAYIQEAERVERPAVCKALEVDANGVYTVGDAQTDDLSRIPFVWQLSLDLEDQCYQERIDERGGFSTVHDLVLTDDQIYFVGNKGIDGREESLVWSANYCETNSTQVIAKNQCKAKLFEGCMTLECSHDNQWLTMEVFDISGRQVWRSMSMENSWCLPKILEGLLTYRISGQHGDLLAAGKMMLMN